MTPRVSVVLPFRNAGATLHDALRSLTAQSLRELECLLIDDGSVDASAATARRIVQRDRRFRLLAGGDGLVAALNRGLTAARAEIIARMDADDIAHPHRLELQLAALERDPGLAVVSCRVECFPAATLRDGMRRYERWLNALCTPEAIRDAMFIESPIPHPTAMIRRRALDAVGGYRDTGGPEDYDLWLRLLLAGHRVAKVPAVLLAWRDSAGRLSRTDPRYDPGRFFATKLTHFAAAVPPGTVLDLCGAGPTGRRWARALSAQGYPIRRFVDVAARRWGTTVEGIPVVAPTTPLPGGYVLATAGQPGARERIEEWLLAHGCRPWRDYLAVA